MLQDFFDKFRAQCHDVYTRLLLKFYDYTFAYFFVRTGNRHDTEDLNQDLWVRVYARAGQFAGGTVGEFFQWVKKIAYRLILDRGAPREVPCDLDALVSRTASPEDHASLREAAERMLVAMSMLNEGDRDILIFYFYQCLSHLEVATLLGVSQEAARVRLHRALVRYGEILRSSGSDPAAGTSPRLLGETLSYMLPLIPLPPAQSPAHSQEDPSTQSF